MKRQAGGFVRRVLAWACAVALSLPAAVHGQSTPPQEDPTGKHRLEVEIAATNAVIRTRCPHPTPEDRGALLRDELRLSNAIRDAGSAEGWHALACVRANLYAVDAVGREGLLMPLGTSWHRGATAALLKGVERDPSNGPVAELLGFLALAEENVAEPDDEIAGALASASTAGVRGTHALRGCAAFSYRTGNLSAATQCSRVALEAGVDSVWHLLRLARLAFVTADTTAGLQLFNRAVYLARDSASLSHVSWHLRWFLEPGEEAAWRTLADSARPAWVRDRLASRDIKDGRPTGSRLATHFARLDTVEARFSVPLARRHMARFDNAATPEARNHGASARDLGAWYEPGLIAAQPFREFRRWEHRFDDRAVIWMRYGPPEKRIQWTGRDTAGVLGCALVCPKTKVDARGITNTREAWRYPVDDGALLLSFESEQFSGAVEATRLVAGVLGSYLCDVDTRRCNATNRSQMAFSARWEMPRDPRDPVLPALPQEVMAQILREDYALIREGTQKDDNAVRVRHPIATVAQFSRVWDPASGVVLAVIPYTVRAGDVQRSEDSAGVTATMAVTVRQWDPVVGSTQSTDFIRNLRLPARLRNNSHLTGYLVTPSSSGTRSWSLVTAQGDEYRGRAYGEGAPLLGNGALVLSDLILGATSQGQVWTTTSGTAVPLGPLGAFNRNEPVALYWQTRSAATHENARVTIALYRVGARGEARPALEVTFDGRIAAGISEWQRDLGVQQLDDGEYRVEVVIRAGELEARRTGRLLLR